MTRRPRMAYDAPQAYEALIAPRYAPIAEALVDFAELKPGERALELGAGTGLVTRLAAPALLPGGTLCATDLSRPMLELARSSVTAPGVSFAVVDYAEPLPFLDASFDVVLSGLTYAQNSRRTLAEVARVLQPGGRLVVGMWGTSYREVRMMSAAKRALGLPGYPSAAPGRAAQRIARAGFGPPERLDLRFAPRFESVEEYIRYRRGFGIPVGSTVAAHERFLRAHAAEATRSASADGTLELDWKIVLLRAARRA